jgi:prevent-host-death family protein
MTMSERKRRSTVGSAEFKAKCLELIDRVRETSMEYTVTRHRVPVATLGPIKNKSSVAFVGSMAGSVLAFDRPLDPIPGAWMADDAG